MHVDRDTCRSGADRSRGDRAGGAEGALLAGGIAAGGVVLGAPRLAPPRSGYDELVTWLALGDPASVVMAAAWVVLAATLAVTVAATGWRMLRRVRPGRP